jgi:hypothetical protein
MGQLLSDLMRTSFLKGNGYDAPFGFENRESFTSCA